MPLVNTKEMFKKAYDEGYAIGAFNVNNMEIVQGIVDACQELRSPVILQVSGSARKYARHAYLYNLVQAAVVGDPVCPSPCIWIMARTLSSARTASTAVSPPL